ncbi:ferredoxin [Nocardia niigatensis]|uniref:ferredoxin n=1 Tax=Nocardia niigatensis TaxID=209249 RepID=UPI001FE0BCA4|nr:ferredoxin [Nocardia niigatensis]
MVNRATCMGMGACEAADPARFEVGHQGELIILAAEFDESRREQIERCVRSCPTGSLSIADD